MDARRPCTAPLLLAFGLLNVLSGCDWGYRSHTYHRSFAQTDAALRKILARAPDETREGWAQYGNPRPGAPSAMVNREDSVLCFLSYEDAVVRVERRQAEQTKVSVKQRKNTGFIFHDRVRLPEAEKTLLFKVGRELQEATPFDREIGTLLHARQARLERLLAYTPEELKAHLDEVGEFRFGATPLIPELAQILDLEKEDSPLFPKIAFLILSITGRVDIGDGFLAFGLPLQTAGRGIARLGLEQASGILSELLQGGPASLGIVLSTLGQRADLGSRFKDPCENSLKRLTEEEDTKLKRLLDNEVRYLQGTGGGHPRAPSRGPRGP